MENAEFERRFPLDYWFGCMVLAHQSRGLNEAHAAEIDPDRRRACFLSIHTNLMSEHAAGWPGESTEHIQHRGHPAAEHRRHGSLPYSGVA